MTQMISVVMPSLNMGRYMGAAMKSIAIQTGAVFEILVADSYSTDETQAVVQTWKERGLNIDFFECPKKGPGIARNEALARATGDVISFLDPDDIWPEGKIERQLARLRRDPAVEMVSGYVRYFDVASDDELAPAPDARTETLFHVHLGSCLYRRDTLDAIGHFDPDFLYSEDVDLLLRMRESGRPFSILRTVELYYRKHDEGMMGRHNPRINFDFSRAALKSLMRRRMAGKEHAPLPDFKDFVEPV